MLCYQVTNCTLPAFTFPAPVSYVPAAYALTRRAGCVIPYAHSRSGIFMQKSYEVVNVHRRNIFVLLPNGFSEACLKRLRPKKI